MKTRAKTRLSAPKNANELQPPLAPMEALLVKSLPRETLWQYEPKWDGFRCLAFRDDAKVFLQSKAQKSLGRYFPEVLAAVQTLAASDFALDGELVVPVGDHLSFDELLMRIHPAESRIRKLSKDKPALYVIFDLLMDAGKSLLGRTLADRRALLEKFAARHFPDSGLLRLSPATTQLAQARKWLRVAGGNLDGVVAKRLDKPYRAGERDGVQKIKRIRSVDCVVGGFRYASRGKFIGSLLLGLYDDDGLLHHVGFSSNIRIKDRPRVTAQLQPLIAPPGFTGRAPGGPSRWATARSTAWQPLAPRLVVEVAYDHFSAGRFRHGATLLRWRPDKAPRQCTLKQVQKVPGPDLHLLGTSF